MGERIGHEPGVGLWVALFGPDGAGKSAVIKRMVCELSIAFDGVERFHFRPKFRRQWRDAPPQKRPHEKAPRSSLISVLKLIYWLADGWYGYMATIRPARANSRLVIYDRHYDDILIDPRRYRLPASCLWFARLLVRLAPRPDLYVLLDVPAEVVQERKSEVSCEESQRQRQAYLGMFANLPNAVVIDATSSLDVVANQVNSIVLDFLTNRPPLEIGVSPIAGL